MKKHLWIGTGTCVTDWQWKWSVLQEKRNDVLFLQETEIPDGYDLNLLFVPKYKLECEMKSQGNKIRIVRYIHDTVV